MLTRCPRPSYSPSWLIIAILVAISVTGWTPAFAGHIEVSNCAGTWWMSSCVTIDKALGDAYVRRVPEPFSEADRSRAAERDRRWVARCRPVIVQDGYGVPRYRYAAPGCEFGVNKD